ncbi:endonuclease/exonuclease/phosphatase family protein [Alistipes timonensis]|uniref:Metal-dependent hydrolase, endonuclease/exonuclease/phosphatase family n=1 Tax=Alistipes timonensis JC136 TaxID=1033731 RepID=A0A1H3ZI01_9BACT|nr:endonuclease/exonuclease/phosphatase family protein [Alistipes timonensis]MCR2031117.1 endonuclease/exonuclease/phosphatase family protein [Alistipes timonensis]SEA23386.1 Metal-dependent hydrolase, endonuclease/exonuclease/phosphatase family [Alistipes timonensis JC136]
MKKLFFLLALTAAVSCNAPQELTVMTLNMRYDNPEDGANNWRFRRERIAELIRSEAVDLLGTQEVLANQFDDLQALLPGYRAVGVGREDGARAGEFNAVFFRSDRFELLDSGVFWLSENPETPGSKGWDGACERLATWTVLRDKSGGELLFINTHLDHIGEQARREGVALLLRRIETLRAGRPVILTGDFNAEPSSPVVARVVADSALRSAWDTAPIRSGSAWSFSDFGQLPEEERPLIDYVFYGGGLEVVSCSILPDTLGGGYLSDHAPVEARLKYVR